MINNPPDVTASVSFIMAMQWDYVGKDKLKSFSRNPFSISMNERLNMEKALNLLLNVDNTHQIIASPWKPYSAVCSASPEIQHPWSIPSGYNREPLYNEYLYFNHNNRQIIYNQDEVPKKFDNKAAKEYAKQVQKEQRSIAVLTKEFDQGNAYYYLARQVANEPSEYVLYRLPLNSIELRIYNVGIMLLSIRCNHETSAAESRYEVLSGDDLKRYFDVSNPSKPKLTNSILNSLFENNNSSIKKSAADKNDLAWILDCGRRLFCPRSLKESTYPHDLPLYSCISLNQKAENPIALCSYIDQKDATPAESFPWISQLISPHCISINSSCLKCGTLEDSCLVLDSFNDDRMYLHGSVVSNELARNICDAYVHRSSPNGVQMNYLMKWHAIAFADNNWDACTCPDYEMVCKLAEGYTYSRWTGYGTLYALNYHNMIQLLTNDAPKYLTTNMDWIYYQLFLVGVLQRCCLQRFYREASGILLPLPKNKAPLRTALKDKYIIFLNRIWGNEVTEQEQGREMFDILQKNMMLEKDVAFLDQALEELSEQERKSLEHSVNNVLVPLSIIGGFAAIIDLLLGQMSNGGALLNSISEIGAFESISCLKYTINLLRIVCCFICAIPIVISVLKLLPILKRKIFTYFK